MKSVLRFARESMSLLVLVLLGIVFLLLAIRTIPMGNTIESPSGNGSLSANPSPPYPPPGQQPTAESTAQQPYPPPESILQTPTGPKPTSTVEPTPTITPVPTSLSLPPSNYYALWVENFPEGKGSVLWLADPGDIGNRREVLRFERDAIAEASLSPDGSRLALVTTYWKESVLWLANMDGSDLHQLGPAVGAGGELFWSRNSQSLNYGVTLTSLDTSEKRQMFEQQMFEPNTSLRALGYSADGQELYYLVGIPQEIDYKYEIWAIGQDGQGARKLIAFDQNPGLPILSPDGSKFLIGTAEGVAWVSTDGQTQLLSSWKRRCGLIWSTKPDEVIRCQVDEQQPIEYISAVHILSGITQELASLVLPDGKPYGPLAISPDHQWLVTAQYGNSSLYWIHLASGAIVPIPMPNRGSLRFIAWLPATP